jgi:hypothetical protein
MYMPRKSLFSVLGWWQLYGNFMNLHHASQRYQYYSLPNSIERHNHTEPRWELIPLAYKARGSRTVGRAGVYFNCIQFQYSYLGASILWHGTRIPFPWNSRLHLSNYHACDSLISSWCNYLIYNSKPICKSPRIN